MSLKLLGYIDLPAHLKRGGFDHAAVHSGLARLYVAHTSNDAVDVVDCSAGRYLHSIAGLTGVAGALVAERENLLFTSNRGENTVGILPLEDGVHPDGAHPDGVHQDGIHQDGADLARVAVGVRPNGLAYSPAHHLLLAANVGDPQQPGSFTVSLVAVRVVRKVGLSEVEVPGRTRWTVYDAQADVFYVNIADPAQIVVIDAASPTRIARAYPVPAAGPHGLDLDAEQRRLFCACDAHRLISLEASSGAVLNEMQLGGGPDVIFFNAALRHLYVASGEPGLIEVIDTDAWRRIETVPTEVGAHTLAFDAPHNKVYAFLPATHRAAVYVDGE